MSYSLSRRELLQWASAGAGAAVVGGGTWLLGRTDHAGNAPIVSGVTGTEPPDATDPGSAPTSAQPAPVPAPVAAGDPAARMLVVIEMDGGNDGLSTLVPHGMGEYYDLRPRTAVGEADVLALTDTVGLHNKLANVHRRGAAIVQGIGSPQPDGSHFEMMARWWSGDPLSAATFDTGFLGRLADAIGDPAAAAVAVSIGSGTHPAMYSRKAGTLSIPSAGAFSYVAGASDDDPLLRAFQRGMLSMARGSAAAGRYDELLRAVKGQSIAFAGDFGSFDNEGDGGYPSGDLGQGLRLAAQMLAADSGVRIVHVPMHADFDTHDDHSGRHPALLESFDLAVEAFLTDIEARGLAERVLVMTTSEFGRTAHDNSSGGLDHGTASTALLLGPVNAGLFGEHPSLTGLDDNGDLIATVPFDQYYAGVAEGWFGVPAGDVLGAGISPLTGLFS